MDSTYTAVAIFGYAYTPVEQRQGGTRLSKKKVANLFEVLSVSQPSTGSFTRETSLFHCQPNRPVLAGSQERLQRAVPVALLVAWTTVTLFWSGISRRAGPAAGCMEHASGGWRIGRLISR